MSNAKRAFIPFSALMLQQFVAATFVAAAGAATAAYTWTNVALFAGGCLFAFWVPARPLASRVADLPEIPTGSRSEKAWKVALAGFVDPRIVLLILTVATGAILPLLSAGGGGLALGLAAAALRHRRRALRLEAAVRRRILVVASRPWYVVHMPRDETWYGETITT